MKIKTKASHWLWPVKAKNCFLNADSGVQLDDTGAAFQDTSALRVVTQHHRGPTQSPFLFYNEVLQFTFHPVTENQRWFGKRDGVCSWIFFPPLTWGKTSLASISFSLLKGRKGHRHREITVESVAARNQTTAGFSHGLESRRLHAVHRAGFYWPFSITPVTQDWVCRSASFS